MHRTIFPLSTLTLTLTLALCSAQAASLQEAANALGVANTKSIEYAGSGRWFQFGQAPNPGLPWPQFDVSSYAATINYDNPSARVLITRKQAIDPGRVRPIPVEQRVEQYVIGSQAWNATVPPNSPAGTAPTVTPQLAAAQERQAEIWATPQGFIKAALANNAVATPAGGDGLEVSFTAGGKFRYVGTINAHNKVEHVKTWIDNPVLGDTLVETHFRAYKDFNGILFPTQITRTQGGFPVLDLAIQDVKLNPPLDLTAPPAVVSYQAPPVVVNKLADGVYYLTGGTHHSVAIEQGDRVVFVEAPLNEERSLAVISKVHDTIPNKPIKYVVASHVHFDHSGGLRTLVDEGATVVAHELDKPYFEKAWANPHTLNPDRLAKSQKAAQFETYSDKRVLADGTRPIEIYRIAENAHSDDLALIYLPKEKILIEADAYTPTAANVPPPANPNPYSVNLYDNIQKLKLEVSQIAALHGPRVVTLADLRTAIGRQQVTVAQ
jgi:glyoxylase-like metal-dependent hydrolase (beta-lactamase superfamily II)